MPASIPILLLLAKFGERLALCQLRWQGSQRCCSTAGVLLKKIRRAPHKSATQVAPPSRSQKWRKGVDERDAIRIFSGNQIARQNTPGALRIPDASRSCEHVDSVGKFDALIDDLTRQGLRQQNRAGLAKGFLAGGVRHVRPVFKERPAPAGFRDNLDASLEADEIAIGNFALFHKGAHRFDALASTRHGFRARERSVADSAVHAYGFNFEAGSTMQKRKDRSQRFFHSAQFGLARAADRHENIHTLSRSVRGENTVELRRFPPLEGEIPRSWSGIRESNSRLHLGKVAYYHYTNPAR